MKATRLLSHGGATVAAGLMAYGTGTAVAWARFPNREIVVGTNPQHPHPGSRHRR